MHRTAAADLPRGPVQADALLRGRVRRLHADLHRRHVRFHCPLRARVHPGRPVRVQRRGVQHGPGRGRAAVSVILAQTPPAPARSRCASACPTSRPSASPSATPLRNVATASSALAARASLTRARQPGAAPPAPAPPTDPSARCRPSLGRRCARPSATRTPACGQGKLCNGGRCQPDPCLAKRCPARTTCSVTPSFTALCLPGAGGTARMPRRDQTNQPCMHAPLCSSCPAPDSSPSLTGPGCPADSTRPGGTLNGRVRRLTTTGAWRRELRARAAAP